MSLVEDARILGGFGPYFKRGDEATCWYCRETVIAHELYHDPTCPWLALPRIVAALEAAERMVEQLDLDGPWTSDPSRSSSHLMVCRLCEVDLERGYHADTCVWKALVSALAAGREEGE